MKHKLDCRIIQDLLPSYVDGLTSNYTNQEIEAHLKDCPECSRVLARMSEPDDVIDVNERGIDFMKKIKKTVIKWKTISGTAILLLFLVIAAVIILYERMVPRSFSEIFDLEDTKLITYEIEQMRTGTILHMDDDEFIKLLENTDYYYSGKQDRTIIGDLYMIDIYDSEGIVLNNIWITNQNNLYYNDKEYHFRAESGIFDYIYSTLFIEN